MRGGMGMYGRRCGEVRRKVWECQLVSEEV